MKTKQFFKAFFVFILIKLYEIFPLFLPGIFLLFANGVFRWLQQANLPQNYLYTLGYYVWLIDNSQLLYLPIVFTCLTAPLIVYKIYKTGRVLFGYAFFAGLADWGFLAISKVIKNYLGAPRSGSLLDDTFQILGLYLLFLASIFRFAEAVVLYLAILARRFIKRAG